MGGLGQKSLEQKRSRVVLTVLALVAVGDLAHAATPRAFALAVAPKPAAAFRAEAKVIGGRVQLSITNVGPYDQVIDISCTPAFQSGFHTPVPVLPDPQDPGVVRVMQSSNHGHPMTTKVMSSCWRGVTQTWKPGETRSVMVPDSRLAAGTHLISTWVSFELMRHEGGIERFFPYRERVQLSAAPLQVTVTGASAHAQP